MTTNGRWERWGRQTCGRAKALSFAAAAASSLGAIVVLASHKLSATVGPNILQAALQDAGKTVGSGGVFGAIGAAMGAIGGWIGGSSPRGLTVQSATPGVKVGRDGGWNAVSPGTKIGEGDYMRIPPGDKATVTLPDGTVTEFTGRSVVPGNWDPTNSQPDAVTDFVQAAARAILGETTRTKGGGGKA